MWCGSGTVAVWQWHKNNGGNEKKHKTEHTENTNSPQGGSTDCFLLVRRAVTKFHATAAPCKRN